MKYGKGKFSSRGGGGGGGVGLPRKVKSNIADSRNGIADTGV